MCVCVCFITAPLSFLGGISLPLSQAQSSMDVYGSNERETDRDSEIETERDRARETLISPSVPMSAGVVLVSQRRAREVEINRYQCLYGDSLSVNNDPQISPFI